LRYDIHGCVEGEEEEEEDERKMERRVCPIKSASNVRCSRERLHSKKKVAVVANRRKEVEYRYL
jgi:hypothetical protein